MGKVEPISELSKASLSKRDQVPNFSYDKEFNLHWTGTKARLENEAKGNLKMAYSCL